MKLPEKKRRLLVDLLGEDRVKQLEADVEAVKALEGLSADEIMIIAHKQGKAGKPQDGFGFVWEKAAGERTPGDFVPVWAKARADGRPVDALSLLADLAFGPARVATPSPNGKARDLDSFDFLIWAGRGRQG